ncbi:MAG TPA: hypothetical protein DCS93_22800 [Microscillaceae bacterium]|nr:hypothetical protein [Microscillaceae bacterium]
MNFTIEQKWLQLLHSPLEANVLLAMEMKEGMREINYQPYLNAYLKLYRRFFDKNLQTLEPNHILKLNQRRIDASWQNLKLLPTEIKQLKKLEDLQLYSNQLEELPAEIGQLTNLQCLGVGENKLKKLPKELCSLPKLTGLALFNNRLEVLPAEIGQMQSLVWLHLNGNRITHLPKEIKALQNLRELWIQTNPIADDEIAKLREWLPNCQINF